MVTRPVKPRSPRSRGRIALLGLERDDASVIGRAGQRVGVTTSWTCDAAQRCGWRWTRRGAEDLERGAVAGVERDTEMAARRESLASDLAAAEREQAASTDELARVEAVSRDARAELAVGRSPGRRGTRAAPDRRGTRPRRWRWLSSRRGSSWRPGARACWWSWHRSGPTASAALRVDAPRRDPVAIRATSAATSSARRSRPRSTRRSRRWQATDPTAGGEVDRPAPTPARLTVLRRRYHELGAGNPFAADELAEVTERLDALETQHADLESAIAGTRELIARLEQHIADQFRQTFSALEDAFGRRFRQLFGGGEAQLSLTQPGRPVGDRRRDHRPAPGKKRQPLAMLSGGERALTAVALLLAMLEVRPVPFCVLDEVDAALDEANVGRFAAALRGLAETIQFVVITHNRGTIEAVGRALRRDRGRRCGQPGGVAQAGRPATERRTRQPDRVAIAVESAHPATEPTVGGRWRHPTRTHGAGDGRRAHPARPGRPRPGAAAGRVR